ncbi:MAG: tetratricopeptide repeat protein [Paludibacteraceae bacterium]|nr:tetratricopeptide repeat protein [Paludibacteraceae bacterium]
MRINVRKILFFIVAAVFSNHVLAANHHDEFFGFIKAKDTVQARKSLINWQKEEPNSADMYAGWYNYYYWSGMQENLSQSVNLPDGVDDYLLIRDSTGKHTGYLYSVVSYCKDSIEQAFRLLDEGTAKNPQRLDLHFGRVYLMFKVANGPSTSVCGQVAEKWDNKVTLMDISDYLCQLLDASDSKNWLWLNSEKMDDGEEFFYDNMQSYFVEFMGKADFEAAEKLVDKLLTKKQTLKFRADKASLLASKGEYSKAVSIFSNIHKDYPKDDIVTWNTAMCYEKMGDTKNALKYYKKIEKSTDVEWQSKAKEAVFKLKMKK